MCPFNHSTIAVVEVDASKLAQTEAGELAIKVATIHQEASSVLMDDFLNPGMNDWKKISIESSSQSYRDLPRNADPQGRRSKRRSNSTRVRAPTSSDPDAGQPQREFGSGHRQPIRDPVS